MAVDPREVLQSGIQYDPILDNSNGLSETLGGNVGGNRNIDMATLQVDLAGSGGGGNTGVGNVPISVTPTSRTLSFTITSSPNGGSIFVNGINSGYTTPHTLQYSESELLSPKTVSVVNGTNNSVETYILSSQTVTTTTGGSYGGGYSGGGGGSGAGGGTSNNGMYETGLPFYQQQNIK